MNVLPLHIERDSFCDKCRKRVEKGNQIIKYSGKTIRWYCVACSSTPAESTAFQNCFCKQCNRKITSGQKCGWSPVGGTVCSYCKDGKDSARADLKPEERDRLQRLLDRGGSLLKLPKPWSKNAQNELSEIIKELKTEFGNLQCVRKFLDSM